ncbi:MAG: ATP-binding cassette domain-containing protein, partial [Candidatus Cloacimonetes bacterium]|nr:ATP-binding cassette domain-containing protein [Candidatus Cloacimonadota bacterium]
MEKITSPASCITLHNTNLHYGTSQVLFDFSLSIPKGMIYGLLGPSGCGKTSTVKLMAGILEASSGAVYVLDQLMPQLSVMNRIGYMAQSDALYPLLTAAENLSFFSGLYGLSGAAAKEKIKEV